MHKNVWKVDKIMIALGTLKKWAMNIGARHI